MRSLIIPLAVFGLSLVSALKYRGADFSSLLLLESTTDIQYRASSSSEPQPFEQILKGYGVNLARVRIWTSGTYSLSYGLEFAKRAKAVGMDLMVALYYSDSWANPGYQPIPSGWPDDLEGLQSQVYNYTYGLVQAFNSQGTPIQYIQIGNEINDGFLWPIGQITSNGFDGASRLLHAGALAVRDASPSTNIVIHLGTGWAPSQMSWFFGGIFTSETDGGLGSGLTLSDVDLMAVSWYPYYGTQATFSTLNATLNFLVSTYNKDVMVAETGWPVVCNTEAVPLSEPSIPVGVQGQITWIEDVVAVLNSVNHIHGNKALGIVYWEPGWTTNSALGSLCADVLLVTSDGVAMQSMTMFSNM
ncbi:glycoside hydrolase family 53 protein [Tylopilus felleus]